MSQATARTKWVLRKFPADPFHGVGGKQHIRVCDDDDLFSNVLQAAGNLISPSTKRAGDNFHAKMSGNGNGAIGACEIANQHSIRRM